MECALYMIEYKRRQYIPCLYANAFCLYECLCLHVSDRVKYTMCRAVLIHSLEIYRVS